MAPSDDGRASLERRLAALLGISIDDDRDYAVDVLEALLEIGDPADAVEYLSGFVAGDAGSEGGEDLLGFAQDVERFKRGEEIDAAPTESAKDEEMDSSDLEAKPKAKAVLDEAAAHREEIRRREAAAKERQREEQDRLAKKQQEEEEQMRIREEAAAALAEKKMAEKFSVKKAAAKPKPHDVSKMQTSALKGASAKQPHNQSKEAQKQKSSGETIKKAEPKPRAKKQQAKAKKGNPNKNACGCFGNKHKPLTNCLHCGRIACEAEGINDYCHFCGHFIEDFSSKTDGNAKIASALRHKERLLQFDRESVKRTHIHDDQEDYFAASNSMWATNDEQEDARQLEEERRKKIHERGNQVMSINF